MTVHKGSLSDAFATFSEPWQPRVVAALNGQEVKIARMLGEFDWHKHDHEDEFFLALEGSFVLELRDGSIPVGPGEFVVVPRGVEHRPVATEECRVLLFEPAGTRNTGDRTTDKTVERPKRI